MSTRARANRQASNATVTATSAKVRKRHETDDMAMDVDDNGKEGVNTKAKEVNGRGMASKKGKGAAWKRVKGELLESVDCTCSKGEDGSPMILCSMCKIWYHFTCVEITEPQAEEINVYICPSCTQTTGRRSAMHWEGEQAVEECTDEDETTVIQRRRVVMKARPGQQKNGRNTKLVEALKFDAEESDEMDDSEDDYVEDTGGGRKKRQSRVRRMSTTTSTSDDDAGSADGKGAKHRRIRRLRSPSHSPSVHGGKRKAKSISVGQGASPAPPPKRKRSTTGAVDQSAQDDPVRKYCLTKLEDVFKEVYMRYPYVRLKEEDDDGQGQNGVKTIKKELKDMSDEEKEVVVEDSKRFARELEACVYEIYAEPDKNGNPHAAAKYKDRFRTLQFNLSKPDRVIIHQRILSGSLSAKEISGMSSTDLADEETKQSIIQAEKEALEHSILQKQTVPRAKITHKGLQDIEDVRGEIANAQDFELEKERQEDEKRDRERLARLKTSTTQANRQRTASISVPPESPVVPQSATSLDGHQEQWGAPPPVPFRAMVDSSVEETTQEQRPSLYVQTSSEFMNAPEPELNLDDFIHIDEDQDASHTKMTDGEGSTPLVNPSATIVASPTEMTSQTPLSVSTTGISPFAQRQDTPRAPSFDLNALWSERSPPVPVVKDDQPKAATTGEKVLSGTGSVESRDDSDNMELESIEANDQDFDMFLADDAEAEPQPPTEPSLPPSVENLPQVWTGKITMPLDSSVPQETTLVARQVGGKPLGADSPLWRTLFPSDILRIEGRVPVENSIKYLVQMRLNPSKELYAVALVPARPQDENDFKTFNNFLISKSRHGLVFPWGKPKDHHPGRELYMIPLLQTDILPEFVELLDDLKLPKIRSKDYLIGVWILNKGKLTPLPTQSSHPPPVVQPSPAVLLNQPGSVPTMPQLPNPALASEVASLTPDQIQNILRTLASTTQVPMAPQVTQPPFLLHGSVPPQSWIPQPPPPFPYNFPPPNVPFQQPPLHNSPNSPTRYDHSPDRKEYDRSGGYDRDFRSAPSHDHRGGGDRGWRGQSRGRGRGRGRGDGNQDRDFRAQRDSGWPRRPRNDGQDGPSW